METSICGSYLVAMIISMKLTMEMRYKLRILRVNIYVPAQILGDNDIIVISFYILYSTSKNNHNDIS